MKKSASIEVKGQRIGIDTYVRKAIIRHLSQYRKRDYSDSRIIRVSDLYGFCPRRWWIAEEEGYVPVRTQKLQQCTLLTFQIGEKIEEILGAALRDRLAGRWECPKCGSTSNGLEHPCHKCDAKMTYKQTGLQAAFGRFTLVGHPDFLVASDKLAYIIECKSIGVSDRNPHWSYDHLQKPILQHLYQVHGYMFLASKIKNRRPWKDNKGPAICSTLAGIVYIPKVQRQDLVKIYPIKKINHIWNEIRDWMKELEKDKLPARKCKTKNSYMAAKICPPSIVKKCFEL